MKALSLKLRPDSLGENVRLQKAVKQVHNTI